MKVTPLTEDELAVRERIMKICEIGEEDLPSVYMSKILIKLDDLFAQIRLLKESQVHAHLPVVEREIERLDRISINMSLDEKEVKCLDILIKLKQFIYDKPTGASKSYIEKLSEAELIAKLSPNIESPNESV